MSTMSTSNPKKSDRRSSRTVAPAVPPSKSACPPTPANPPSSPAKGIRQIVSRRTVKGVLGGRRRVVPPAGEPRVETPLMIGTTSMELWCSQLVVRMMGLPSSLLRKVVPERCCTGRGYFRDPRLAIRQHHSPLSDGCKGLVFAFTKPSIYCIGCCREGRAGRGAAAASNPTASFRRHGIFRKP